MRVVGGTKRTLLLYFVCACVQSTLRPVTYVCPVSVQCVHATDHPRVCEHTILRFVCWRFLSGSTVNTVTEYSRSSRPTALGALLTPEFDLLFTVY